MYDVKAVARYDSHRLVAQRWVSLGNNVSQSNTIRASYPQNQAFVGN